MRKWGEGRSGARRCRGWRGRGLAVVAAVVPMTAILFAEQFFVDESEEGVAVIFADGDGMGADDHLYCARRLDPGDGDDIGFLDPEKAVRRQLFFECMDGAQGQKFSPGGMECAVILGCLDKEQFVEDDLFVAIAGADKEPISFF